MKFSIRNKYHIWVSNMSKGYDRIASKDAICCLFKNTQISQSFYTIPLI